MHDPGPDAKALRPFVPARDFAASRAFYEELGFRTGYDDGKIAVLSLGPCAFLLQDFYVKDWAENSMLQLFVRDLDAWWSRVEALDLPARYGVNRPTPPRDEPWGMRVSYLWDPAGVLWHITAEPS